MKSSPSNLLLLLLFVLILAPGCLRRPKPLPRPANLWTVQHPRINHFINHYRGREAELLWQQASPYLPYIKKVFHRHGLPRELCLLPMIESSFKPDARSARAAGLWQFVPDTAREMGLKINTKTDERLNWQKSTLAAARYLKWLGQRYNGDWALALAAYNLGPGAITRAMEDQNSQNFWELKLRQETMDYVPRLVALVRIYK